jgi:hypothetical protein
MRTRQPPKSHDQSPNVLPAPGGPTLVCGDPVPSFGDAPPYLKRRMNFSRFTFGGDAVYHCPVCGGIRVFRPTFFGEGFIEVKGDNIQ